jgi:hypothetical protein
MESHGVSGGRMIYYVIVTLKVSAVLMFEGHPPQICSRRLEAIGHIDTVRPTSYYRRLGDF